MQPGWAQRQTPSPAGMPYRVRSAGLNGGDEALDSKSERVGAGEAVLLMAEEEPIDMAVADGERKLLSWVGIGIGIALPRGDGGLANAGIGNHWSAAALGRSLSVGYTLEDNSVEGNASGLMAG